MKSIKYILDSWAVLAFFQDEPSAEAVEQILVSSTHSSASLLISSVNLGEVWYNVARRISTQSADFIIEKLLSLGVEVVDIDWKIARQAAQLKIFSGIGYIDCLAAAVAKNEDGVLITGDKEFKHLSEKIHIEWV